MAGNVGECSMFPAFVCELFGKDSEMKNLVCVLFYGGILFACIQTLGEENSLMRQENDDGWNLCHITIDVYPEVLHVGDPLYIRVNFHNNTSVVTYAYSICVGDVDAMNIWFDWRECEKIYAWHHGNQSYEHARRCFTKIEPGEKGPSQYLFIGFPEEYESKVEGLPRSLALGFSETYAGMRMFWCQGYDVKRWKEIRELTPGREVVGHLVMNVNGDRISTQRDNLLFTAVSSPIVIRSRNQEEIETCQKVGLALSPFSPSRQKYDLQSIELIVSELTPGTLKNLFKWQLLLIELEGAREESQIIEKIETFLMSLNEIERNGLRRAKIGY